MRLLPLLVAVSGQSWFTYDWAPFRTKTQPSYYNFGYARNSPAISQAQTVGCNSCTGGGCPPGLTCTYNALAYNPQPCSGVCMVPPDTSNYYSGTGYYDFTVDPYNLWNAYHTPSSSYNTPPDWGRCTSANTCQSCVSVNGCAWSGTYCSFSSSISCTGAGCAYEPRQCTTPVSGTCAGQTTCFSCTSQLGCAWSGSTCYLAGTPCTTFGCANAPNQCHNTGAVVQLPCGQNEVWATCVSSNCHEDNCQDYYSGGDRVCQNDCWSGCQCAAGGFARLGDTCILRNQCPLQDYNSYYGR